MRKKLKRLLALVMVFSITMSLLSGMASATEETSDSAYAFECIGDWTSTVYKVKGTGTDYEPAHLFKLQSGDTMVPAYCTDRDSNTVDEGYLYKRINLEDSVFYDKLEQDYDTSKKTAEGVRAVLEYGYWWEGKSSADGDYVKSLQDAANSWLSENGFSEQIETLTGNQAIAATQAAIWTHSNGVRMYYSLTMSHDDFRDSRYTEYYKTLCGFTGTFPASYSAKCEAAYQRSGKNIDLFIEYLLGQEESVPKKSEILFSDKQFVSASTVLSEAGGNNTYTITASFSLVTDLTSGLTLTATLDDQTKTDSDMTLKDGIYTVTFENVDLSTAKEIKLKVVGTQYVNGFYYYEVQPVIEDRDEDGDIDNEDVLASIQYTAQNMVGRYNGATKVEANATIKVEAADVQLIKYNKSIALDDEAEGTVKVDSKYYPVLPGATFELHAVKGGEDKVINTFTTDANGEINVSGLLVKDTYGNIVNSDVTYYFKETNAPDGYVIVEDGNIAVRAGDTILVGNDIERTEVSVEKVWDDHNDEDGFRHDEIEVQLYEVTTTTTPSEVEGEEPTVTPNKTPVGAAVTLNDGNDWEYTWEDLPKYYYENGVKGDAIEYAVEETGTYSGYTTDDPEGSKNDDGTFSYTITNTHEVKTSISVKKEWSDANNQDGIRDTSVQVQLLKDDVAVPTEDGGVVTLNAANGWTHEWTGLTKYKGSMQSEEIEYKVEEILPSGSKYTPVITEGKETDYIITNTYEPEKTAVTVEKVWDDNDDGDAKRPASIQVQLYEKITETTTSSEGEETESTRYVEVLDPVTLNGKNSWTTAWNNLPKYRDEGVEIIYTVDELELKDADGKPLVDEEGKPLYAKKLEGTAATGFKIINSYEWEKTSVSVKKIWVDNDDQDGMRPDEITVKLLANGVEAVDENGNSLSQTLKASDGWKYTWTGLPKNKGGEAIDYTVKEVLDEDTDEAYTTVISDDLDTSDAFSYTITNTHAIEKTSVSVEKKWEDANNQDGIRDESVTVQLMNGVTVVGTEILSAANNWKYTWTDLDEYANGEKIKYTVVETNVPEGYEVSITPVEDANDDGVLEDGKNFSFTVTNTHETYKTKVTVTKVWVDDDNRDGVRPVSITVQLKNGNQVLDVQTLCEANHWTYTWDPLEKRSGGADIVYTVKEILDADTAKAYTTADPVGGVNEDDGTFSYTITNTHIPETTFVSVEKKWVDNDNQDGKRPDEITVKLLANGVEAVDENGKSLSHTLKASDGWKYTWTGLPKNEGGEAIAYTVKEVLDDDTAKAYTTADPVGGVNEDDGTFSYTITNTHQIEKIDISGSKSWEDNDNQDGIRPTSITINLKADGEKIKSATVKADEGGNWTYEFTGLEKYKNGNKINYEITEETVEGYETKIEGYNVTNTHKPDETEITVTKVWDDNHNRDGVRPASITVRLWDVTDEENKSELDSKVIAADANGDWKGKFENLPKFKNGGTEIKYAITEDRIVDAEGNSLYTTEINGSAAEGYTITNTHKIAETEISGVKTWVDNDDQDGKRPEEITIRLWNGNTEVRSATVKADKDGNWTYRFTGLPKNENGEPITYTITEDQVNGYTAKVDGYNVTNTHTPETVDVEGSKTWNDSKNQDGVRPASITINLLADGKEIDEKIVTAEENWQWSWTGLDQYKDGKEIKYTITEDQVEGYTAKVAGYDVTNTHKPATVDVKGSKTWNDAGNQDGKRPESITIRLRADGTEVRTATVTEKDNWKWSFTDLPKYANGKEIVYTIAEDGVSGYSTVVDGYNVTNSYTPGKTSVTVNKVWKDDGNRDGIRPVSIQVQLYADKVAYGEVVTLTAESGWTYTWNELDEKAAGQPISYTVAEVGTVDGYTSTVDGYIITNTHVPEKTEVSGVKTWNDANDQDGKRPASITINLLANGEKIDSKVVTAADGWKWNWTGLNKYANGEEIKYTITEDAVKDYTATYSGYNVTNSYTPGKTSISVNKIWLDDNDRDDLRPESIQVQLLANGTAKGEAVALSAENNWSYSWSDLDEKAAGQKIVYTVDEVSVPAGYSKSITGDAATGYTITNSHGVVLTSVNGSKTWNDNNNQDGKRPESITINLLANGVKIQSKTVTAADGWEWSFENLPVNENGKKVAYSITEDAVAGYSTSINGYDVTNSYTPGKTSVGVTKVWDDDGNRDGVRPASVTVKLLANGSDTGKTLTLDANNGWKGSFTGLDEYVSGSRINYTIEEVTVAGYTVAITGSAAAGYTVTNSRGMDKTTVSGSKTWNDMGDQDGKRPASITINLFANGEKVDSKTVTAADGWKWSFTGLPKNEGGKAITYTITEDAVAGYSSEVKGYDVTNSYTPGQTSVTVKKEWNDDGNRDGIRPESIQVQLLADGAAKGEPVTLNAENSWTHTWNGLDEKAGGKTIDYTVAEVGTVEGYISTVSGYTITNTHEVKKTSIDVEKVWKNTSNPPEIDVIIKLLADGEEVNSLTLNEGNNWKGTFSDLPVNKDGVAITYTIEEVKVSGFTTKITGSADEGFTVTNTKKDYDRPGDEEEDDGGSDEATYTLTADKTLNGKKANGFTFEVKDANGTVVATTSAKSGKITFPTFRYDAEGTYTYTVSEVAGTNSNVIYDDSVYTLTVTVSKDGEELVAACTGLEKDGEAVESIRFENTYDGERFYDDDEEELFEEDIPLGGLDAPETGDAGMLWALTAAVSGMGLVGLNFFPKKRKEDEE